MFNRRAFAVYFVILSGLAGGSTTVAQELSSSILRAVPRVAERLHSADIDERISVLDEVVTERQEGPHHWPRTIFPYDLPSTDYSIVVQSILAGNLQLLDERRALTTWGKLNHVIRTFKLKELAKPITRYLPESDQVIQFDIVRTLKSLEAIESAPQIAALLQSPRESVRRQALETLVSLRAREALQPLMELMQDKDESKRHYAMTSLVAIKGREAAVDVAKMLEDPSETNRYWALDTLVQLNAREYAPALWKLTESNQNEQTQRYALAALIHFSDARAIPLAVKKATDPDVSRRNRMLEFLVQVKANAIAPTFVALLESNDVLGGNPPDVGTNMNIRRDLMVCLGQLEAREAIPVLRAYARSRDPQDFLRRAAVTTLGVFRAKESVDDLLPLLDLKVTGDESATAEAGVALAKIGERRTWQQLIDLAARPSCPYRSEIISELNRHLDSELWQRVQSQRVNGLYVTSVKTTTESFARESGIRMVLDYVPGRDSSLRAALPGETYPWSNTSGTPILLSYGLSEIVAGLSDDRIPRTYTFIFDDKQIRILSVERAIEWWRTRMLVK